MKLPPAFWSLSCCLLMGPFAFAQPDTSADVVCEAEGQPPPKRHRLFVGTESGFLYSRSLVVDGQAVEPEGDEFAFNLKAGSGIRLSDDWGVLALARLGTWQTDWATHRGEDRWRYDLAAGPELVVEQTARRPHQTWHIALPLGGTVAKSTPGPSRTLEHSYSLGYGLSAGLIISYVLSGLHHGAHFDGSFTTHVTWIGHESWKKDDPGIRDEQGRRPAQSTKPRSGSDHDLRAGYGQSAEGR